MHLLDAESIRQQQRMILILDHNERIASHDLVRHIPGRGGSAGPPAYFEAGTLAEGVQGETCVFTQDSSVGRFDGSGRCAKMLAQKLLEGPLADEADAG